MQNLFTSPIETKIDKDTFINLLKVNNIKDYIPKLIGSIDDHQKYKLELDRKESELLQQINDKENNSLLIKFKNKFYNLTLVLQLPIMLITSYSLFIPLYPLFIPAADLAILYPLFISATALTIILLLGDEKHKKYNQERTIVREECNKELKELDKFNINDPSSSIGKYLTDLYLYLSNTNNGIHKKSIEKELYSKIEEFNKLNNNIKKNNRKIRGGRGLPSLSDIERAILKNEINEYNISKETIWSSLKNILTEFIKNESNHSIIKFAESIRAENKDVEIANNKKYILSQLSKSFRKPKRSRGLSLSNILNNSKKVKITRSGSFR